MARKPKFFQQAVKSIAQRYPRELVRDLRRVNDHSHDPADFAREWERACAAVEDGGRPAAAWLGHCTVLVRLGGKTILTDPVLSSRIGVGIGPVTLGVRRIGLPPVLARDLPPIDVVVLSHPHFDHLDKPTLRAIRRPETVVVTARNTRRLIPRGFGAVHEIDWGGQQQIAGLNFSALRPAHWGARTAWDRHRGYNSYLIEGSNGKVLFAGDTAFTDAYDAIPGADLAIFGIGAYEPWIHHHASPEQVWTMFSAMRGAHLLPVHHSTFVLSAEPLHEPMERLLAVAGERSHQVIAARPGDVIELEKFVNQSAGISPVMRDGV